MKERRESSAWPAILSFGFRPFFLFGSFYAGLIILAWIPIFYGTLETTSIFAPVDWHVHETMFGYLAAIITGFLLTAIPNWTGRLPVQGGRLMGLVSLWIAGRMAIFFSADIGWLVTAIVDNLFLLAVTVAAATEIVAGRNWRNLKVLMPVTAFLFANILFHLEVRFFGVSDYSRRLAISAAVILIIIIGGRIIPSFTRNWLARENPGRLPVPFNRFDVLVIVLSAMALLAWTLVPERMEVGILLLAAAAFNLARLARWAGDRAGRNPLLIILHIAYIFVPAGFLFACLAVFNPVQFPPVAAIHAFGVGAIGVMTLAVMTRATLGHTGRELKADPVTCLIYIAIVFAALTRVTAAFLPSLTDLLLISAVLWGCAFWGFCIRYGDMLLRPRLKQL